MKNRTRITMWAALCAAIVFTLAPAGFAQQAREQVAGVKNFGRVTERYFRGGAITATGIQSLAALGVRTIIDLRDSPNADEPGNAQRHGIKYFNFPMTGHDTPSDKAVSEILSLIQTAKAPVFVHCSAGKHRAGTIAALYRTRVQGWPKERAWAEQQSYGFGSADGHPQLYAYVYGRQAVQTNADVARVTDDSAAVNDEEKSSKKKKKKKDDDDDSSKDKSKDKKKKKKKDEADSAKGEVALTQAETAAEHGVATPAERQAQDEPVKTAPAGLSSTARYLPLADAINRARAAGGQGEVLKLDLEWDAGALVTWDVTFSSGTEYELEAASGKLLGTKSKTPAKLATLAPLAPLAPERLRTFQEILRKAETSSGQTVLELELKQLKGRAETVFEVSLADGTTLTYDAATGNVTVAVARTALLP